MKKNNSSIDCREHCVDTTTNTWWKDNMEQFPKLSILARKYLSCPPSSAESERTFSVGGQICSKTRNCLSEENCEMLMFLGCNLPMMPMGKFT